MWKKLAGSLASMAVAVAVTAGPASAATGAQRFTVIIHESGGQTSCLVVASGVISGVGSCTFEEQGDVSFAHITMPDGTFDYTTTELTNDGTFNQQACVFRYTSTATASLVGTSGAYLGLTGSATETDRGIYTLPHTSTGCDRSGESGVTVVTASGTVSS